MTSIYTKNKNNQWIQLTSKYFNAASAHHRHSISDIEGIASPEKGGFGEALSKNTDSSDKLLYMNNNVVEAISTNHYGNVSLLQKTKSSEKIGKFYTSPQNFIGNVLGFDETNKRYNRLDQNDRYTYNQVYNFKNSLDADSKLVFDFTFIPGYCEKIVNSGDFIKVYALFSIEIPYIDIFKNVLLKNIRLKNEHHSYIWGEWLQNPSPNQSTGTLEYVWGNSISDVNFIYIPNFYDNDNMFSLSYNNKNTLYYTPILKKQNQIIFRFCFTPVQKDMRIGWFDNFIMHNDRLTLYTI